MYHHHYRHSSSLLAASKVTNTGMHYQYYWDAPSLFLVWSLTISGTERHYPTGIEPHYSGCSRRVISNSGGKDRRDVTPQLFRHVETGLERKRGQVPCEFASAVEPETGTQRHYLTCGSRSRGANTGTQSHY